jgi:hypothetical protein
MEPLEEEVIAAVGGIFVVNSTSLARYFERSPDKGWVILHTIIGVMY